MRRLSLADCISQDRQKNEQKENDYMQPNKTGRSSLDCTQQQEAAGKLPTAGPWTYVPTRRR
jgi:hypothetical protein